MAVLRRHITIRLHDTDAAGILFFGRQFYLAHDSYEEFMAGIGFPLSKVLGEKHILIPIIHAESDYLRPLRVGDEIEIALTVANIGNTSYILEYALTDLSGNLVGKARTVHVILDRQSGQKIPIPEPLRARLLEFQSAE